MSSTAVKTENDALKGHNVCLMNCHKSVIKFVREAGGAVSLSVSRLTTLLVTERGLAGNQVDILNAETIARELASTGKGKKGRTLEILSRKEFCERFPGLPPVLRRAMEAPTANPAGPLVKDFYTERVRHLLSLIPDRTALVGQRVALVSDLAFDVTETEPADELVTAESAASAAGAAATPVVAGSLRRHLSYYASGGESSTMGLLVAGAGGRFVTDIDATTTTVVTGTAPARSAMEAAEGKGDRFTTALRQKIDAGRSGGPLAVLNVATFFTTFGLLNAARFAVPLCGPSHANLAVLLEMPDLLLKSADEITKATEPAAPPAYTAPPVASVASASAMKAESIHTVGLAVPVAVAGVGGGVAGLLGGTSLLTTQEQKWMEFLPVGLGKPLAGSVITLLGGSFDLGDLSRVLDVVAKAGDGRGGESRGPDVVMRFELVSGWSADQFADLVKFLGGKLTKSLSGNTTLALFGHESNEFGPKPELLEAQMNKGSKRPGGVLQKMSITEFALKHGLAPLLLNGGWNFSDGTRRRFLPIPGLAGRVDPPVPADFKTDSSWHKPCMGAAKLHVAVSRGWVSSADAAVANAWMGQRYMQVSSHLGHKLYILPPVLTKGNVFSVLGGFGVCDDLDGDEDYEGDEDKYDFGDVGGGSLGYSAASNAAAGGGMHGSASAGASTGDVKPQMTDGSPASWQAALPVKKARLGIDGSGGAAAAASGAPSAGAGTGPALGDGAPGWDTEGAAVATSASENIAAGLKRKDSAR